jgi:glycerophosphoryl diester phosphodiesterase
VDIVSVPKDIMTEENREAAHSSGKRFSAWTLNTEDEISKAIDLGVDSYFTDDSALAIKLEKANRAE